MPIGYLEALAGRSGCCAECPAMAGRGPVALRLGVHIIRRTAGDTGDPRYAAFVRG